MSCFLSWAVGSLKSVLELGTPTGMVWEGLGRCRLCGGLRLPGHLAPQFPALGKIMGWCRSVKALGSAVARRQTSPQGQQLEATLSWPHLCPFWLSTLDSCVLTSDSSLISGTHSKSFPPVRVTPEASGHAAPPLSLLPKAWGSPLPAFVTVPSCIGAWGSVLAPTPCSGLSGVIGCPAALGHWQGCL